MESPGRAPRAFRPLACDPAAPTVPDRPPDVRLAPAAAARRAAFWLACAAPAAAAAGPSADDLHDTVRAYRVVRARGPVRIDGRDDDEVWRRAPFDDRFTERQPELGARPPYRTAFKAAYDDRALYVFVRVEIPPETIRVRTLRRDSFGIFADDDVVLKIDPMHDRRTAYVFGTNAAGAQIDSLTLEDGRVFLSQWDGVWEARARRTATGYDVEFKIPFATLGVRGTQGTTMGFDISRDHADRNATYDWRLIVPPASPASASNFGVLEGFSGIAGGRAVEFVPYVLGRTDFSRSFSIDPRARPNLAAGGNLRVQFATASFVEASVLTDFAQVEVDNVQVASDRFPLFFPERRPFFINGLDTFNFGVPREAQLFFSRRIGLVDRKPVAIAGGLKAYGREGPLSFGILHVQTLGSKADDARGLPEADPESTTVGRVRVQATKTVNVGVMALGNHVFGDGRPDSAAGGFNAQYISHDGRVQGYGFVAGSWVKTPAEPGTAGEDGRPVTGATPARSSLGTSAYGQLQYRGLYVRPRTSWLFSSRGFAAPLGFYRRPGTARHDVAIDFVPRPRDLGLREIAIGPSYTAEVTPDYDRLLTQRVQGRISFQWRAGATLEYAAGHLRDDVQNDFVLFGYTVPAALYTGMTQRASFRLGGSRPVQFRVGYNVTETFGGILHRPSVGATIRMGPHVTVQGGYDHVVGYVVSRDQTFDFGFANGSFTLAFTPNVAIDNMLRLDMSPGNEAFGLQSRLRARYLPGSDLYVVYRNQIPFGARALERPYHEVIVKLTYYLRAIVRPRARRRTRAGRRRTASRRPLAAPGPHGPRRGAA